MRVLEKLLTLMEKQRTNCKKWIKKFMPYLAKASISKTSNKDIITPTTTKQIVIIIIIIVVVVVVITICNRLCNSMKSKKVTMAKEFQKSLKI